jgi:hypothetical protein
MTGDLYGPPDVAEAYDAWRATCGPAAMAALLGKPVMAVRECFPGFKGYCNPTVMQAALDAAGVKWHATTLQYYWPVNGLAFVQFEGSWLQPGVPVGAAYRRTHWVSVRSRNICTGTKLPPAVYDVNAGKWLTRPEWESEVLPQLLAAHKGATGFHVRKGIEVVLEGKS